jgi:hypothetical protein
MAAPKRESSETWPERPALKVSPRSAELLDVRYERLVIQAGDNSFTLPLHPRLTVIAGVGQLERESLIGELVGAFGAARSGVHAEIVQDDGRHIAVFRPEGGRHRIVDIDTAGDVSDEYADDQGRLDLLSRHGLDLRQARRKMRFSSSDLTSGSNSASTIRRLAECDQIDLWRAADAVHKTDDELQKTAEAVGSTPEAADVVDKIEQQHSRLEAAQARHEGFRKRSMVISFVSALLAIPAMLINPLFAFPLLAIAAVSVLISVMYRTRVERAVKAEASALEAAGAQSYLGFQIQRVNGLLSSEAHRRELMTSASAHRAATASWQALAGDIPVEWALDRKEEILAAARLRKDVSSLSTMSTTAPELDDDRTTDLAHVLVTRLSELRRLGVAGESFPLVLDDPFIDLEPAMKPALLELLGHTAGSPQLIFLTNDEDVASWARLEALTGALAIVEAQPDAAPDNGKPRKRVTA